MILALDIGAHNTGWARSDGASGTWRAEDVSDHGGVLALFSDWMEAELDRGVTLLAVERVFGGNGAMGRLTTAMEGASHAAAWCRKIERTDASADQVRKWLLGYARISVKKEPSKAARTRMLDAAVLNAVRERGFNPTSEHAADAAALLLMVRERRAMKLAA